MWTAIFGLLSSLPKILELMETFALWLSNQIDMAKKRRSIDDMAKAADKSKKEKDTSDIDNLFGGK